MEAGASEAKKPKLAEDISKPESNNEEGDKKPKIIAVDADNLGSKNDENLKEASVFVNKNTSCSENKSHGQVKVDSKTVLVNGSGQKLESIIGRLCSDKTVNSVENDDEEPVLCKADASTQTLPDFVKIVKSLVLKRMKQLEQSLIGGAVADSVLNGKLAELHKENKELRDKTKTLQDKVDSLLNVQKQEENVSTAKVREAVDSISMQAIPQEGGATSPIRRQSAVVSPYNVHGLPGAVGSEIAIHLDGNRSRVEISERRSSRIQGQAPSSSQTSHTSMATTVSHPQGQRHGPQIKYVPHKLPANNQMMQGGPGSHYVRLGHGDAVVQRLPSQRSHASGSEQSARLPGPQVIYTTPPIQVTGPRMSTLPPQPQQMKQHHGMQRPLMSPSNNTVRLAQPGLPPGSSVRLQGPHGQTVHYAPPGVLPGYASLVQQSFTQEKIVPQGTVTRDFRSQPPSSRNVNPSTNDVRFRQGQLPPPQYQNIPRNQAELASPPKLQVNITVSGNGIVLSWDFELEPAANSPVIECYHLFASQDSPNPPTSRSEWKKIGVVKALPLPMACTLTQFVSGNSYHFAVIAIDIHGREGPMSNPCTVRLNK